MPDKRSANPFDPDEWLRFFKKLGCLFLVFFVCTMALMVWGLVEIVYWITHK